ncbi:head-tail connector protein [Arsenophonus sp. PmNCSU2021_1]|uniref:head-tail connector protein n=1 Tax=Arsenophonus sp. PmNCSU2021_1 TaxID=3118989 RepID=UPI002FEF84B5
MLLTLEEIKANCRLETDFHEEDAFLTLISQAVQQRTETHLNRKLYPPDATIPPEDRNGLHLTADIKFGMLLLVTQYYENRSAISDIEKNQLPLGFKWNVQPHEFRTNKKTLYF